MAANTDAELYAVLMDAADNISEARKAVMLVMKALTERGVTYEVPKTPLTKTAALREKDDYPVKSKRKPVPAVPSTRTQLPVPLTPAPRPATALSARTRADNEAAVVTIAQRVIRAVGPDSPFVRDGVVGAVALEKIPCDDELIDAAIQTALQG